MSDNEASGAAPVDRRAIQARVARERAAHFASGIRTETAQTAAAAAPSQATVPAATTTTSWPGPFSTAREVIADRARAARAREAGGIDDDEDDIGGVSSSKRARIQGGATTVTSGPLSRGIVESEFEPTANEWTTPTRATLVAAAAKKTMETVNAGGVSSRGSGSSSLVAIAITALVRVFDHVEDLGPLAAPTREALSISLARARAVDNHAVSVFAASASDSIRIPDCAGVDEAGIVAALRGRGGKSTVRGGSQQQQKQQQRPAGVGARQTLSAFDESKIFGDDLMTSPDEALADSTALARLVSLDLGHCGRCMTDVAVRALVGKGRGALTAVVTPTFPSLSHVALRGTYALSDDGLLNLLSAAPNLRSLRIAATPAIDGAFLKDLYQSCPHLQCLELKSLAPNTQEGVLCGGIMPPPLVIDDVVISKAQPGALSLLKTTKIAVSRESGGGGGAGAGVVATTRPVRSLHGLLGLSSLHSLSLSSLPPRAVSDILLIAAFQTLGPRLRALSLDALDGITDISLGALSVFCLPYAPLHSLALSRLPHVTDNGLDAIAETLQARSSTGGIGPPPLESLTLRALRSVKRSDVLLALILGAIGGFGSGSGSGSGNGGSCLTHAVLSGLPTLTDASLVALSRYASRTLCFLDISASRGITDSGLGALLNSAPRLTRVLIWGATQLSNDVFLGHIRAAMKNAPLPWDKKADEREGEDLPLTPTLSISACSTHPDLVWQPIEFIGRPGETFLSPLDHDVADSEWKVLLI